MNMHVNNARYVEWMIEALPQRTVYLYELDIVFLQESYYEDIIVSQAKYFP